MIRVYLDNCCFNRPFDNQDDIKIKIESISKLFIQKLIKEKKIELAWSYLLETENDKNPFPERHLSISEWKNIACIGIEESEEILNKSESYFKIGVKPMDAIHLACAVFTSCKYFLTTDNGIIKKAKSINDIKILNPIEFVKDLEEI